MTQKVNPSQNRPANAFETAGAISQGGGVDTGYVVDGASPTELSSNDGDITEGNLDSFSESSSGASLSVTINAGEAFVYGSWVVKDTSTNVSLAASTSNQTVYVGWDNTAADTVIIGTSGDFAAEDQKIPIWEYDTDGSGVTATTDLRTIGKENATTSGVASDSNQYDGLAPSDGTAGEFLSTDGTNALWTAEPLSDLEFADGTTTITESSNTTSSGIVYADDYTVQSGVTVTVSDILIVIASNSITVDGTIDATGAGGAGSTDDGDGGSNAGNGENGSIFPIGNGGSGGETSDFGVDGGDGGSGDTRSSLLISDVIRHNTSTLLDPSIIPIGAGGGAGHKGAASAFNAGGGTNGSPPGGGGGGAGDTDSGTPGDGGAGGDGGGGVILIAPDITVTGTIEAAGVNGGNGQGGSNGAFTADGGGGGGGSGGLIMLRAASISDGGATYDVSRGLGGSGAGNAGDGADGEDGEIIKVEL